MRTNTFLPIAILAFNCGDEGVQRDILKRRGFRATKPLQGVYKGESELSWLVVVGSNEDRQDILRLAGEYNQESVLFSGIDRTCELVYVDGRKPDILGVLSVVDVIVAKEHDSYTFDPETGLYWVTL